MPGAARAAFLGLIEVHGPPSAYDTWHADDHQPENWALPGVVYANRWIAPPEAMARRTVSEPALSGAQFLISYFFGDPLEQALAEWNDLADELREAGRMYEGRDVRLGGILSPLGGDLAPGNPISLQALPYCRHQGVYTHIARGGEFGDADDKRRDALLQRDGIIGVLRFGNAGVREYGASQAGRAELWFARGDPLVTFDGASPSDDALFAGVFRTTLDRFDG